MCVFFSVILLMTTFSLIIPYNEVTIQMMGLSIEIIFEYEMKSASATFRSLDCDFLFSSRAAYECYAFIQAYHVLYIFIGI